MSTSPCMSLCRYVNTQISWNIKHYIYWFISNLMQKISEAFQVNQPIFLSAKASYESSSSLVAWKLLVSGLWANWNPHRSWCLYGKRNVWNLSLKSYWVARWLCRWCSKAEVLFMKHFHWHITIVEKGTMQLTEQSLGTAFVAGEERPACLCKRKIKLLLNKQDVYSFLISHSFMISQCFSFLMLLSMITAVS